MSQTVTLTPGVLPADFCWTTPQDYYDTITSLTTAYVAGGSAKVILSASTPAAEDQDGIWVKLDSGGYVEGTYTYLGGWFRPHPIPPGSSVREIYVGTTTALETYDGGQAGAVTATTGPMWEVDTTFVFRIPIGAGTNPTAYDGVSTTIDKGYTAGAEKIAITEAQLPPHTHDTNIYKGAVQNARDSATFDDLYPDNLQGGSPIMVETASTGDGDYVSVLPPVIGVYFIKRTARKFIQG